MRAGGVFEKSALQTGGVADKPAASGPVQGARAHAYKASSTHPVRKSVNRRDLLKGAGALGAIAAIAGGATAMSGCTQKDEDAVSQPLSISGENIIPVMDSFVETEENPPHMVQTANYNIAAGTILQPAEGYWSAALIQGAGANPLVKAGVFSLASGSLATVVEKPIDPTLSTVIQEAHASEAAYSWLEVDTNSGAWSLYGAAFSAGRLTSSPVKLYSADGQWDAPQFAAAGNAIVFQVMPKTGGTQTRANSNAYLWRPGMTEPKQVLASQGRFAAPPSVSEGQAIFTPRVKQSQGTSYALSAYSIADDLATNTITLVLPSPIKPAAATMVGGRLAYTVDAAYDSAGVLGKLGTFVQTDAGNTNTTQNFYFINREPYAAPTGNDSVLVVKNRASYLVFVLPEKIYGNLYATNRAVDYGEYPLRTGNASDFATYSSVKDVDTGRPVSVNVRVFAYR